MAYCNRTGYATRCAHYLAKPSKTTNSQIKECIFHLRNRYSVNILDKRNCEKTIVRGHCPRRKMLTTYVLLLHFIMYSVYD